MSTVLSVSESASWDTMSLNRLITSFLFTVTLWQPNNFRENIEIILFWMCDHVDEKYYW